MTEAEWLSSANALDMLGPRSFRPSDRKLRLVALGWWHDPFHYRELRGEPRSEWELACGELVARLGRFVEGEASSEEVQFARLKLEFDPPDLRYAATSYAYDYLTALSHEDAWLALAGCWRVLNSDRHAHEDPDRADYDNFLRCERLREVVGNPFRAVRFAPSWRTSDVLLLARGIYEGRAFDRMPILADALQDAGCDSEAILNHCRDASATHVRGCWVVDLVLGKT
jgi:hypothetical protein